MYYFYITYLSYSLAEINYNTYSIAIQYLHNYSIFILTFYYLLFLDFSRFYIIDS